AGLAEIPAHPDEPAWSRWARAKLQLGLGRARRAQGNLVGAREVLRASLPELEAYARNHLATAIERQLGRARIELAFALAGSGANAAEVASIASDAAAWLRRVDGRPEELAALEHLEAMK